MREKKKGMARWRKEEKKEIQEREGKEGREGVGRERKKEGRRK